MILRVVYRKWRIWVTALLFLALLSFPWLRMGGLTNELAAGEFHHQRQLAWQPNRDHAERDAADLRNGFLSNKRRPSAEVVTPGEGLANNKDVTGSPNLVPDDIAFGGTSSQAADKGNRKIDHFGSDIHPYREMGLVAPPGGDAGRVKIMAPPGELPYHTDGDGGTSLDQMRSTRNRTPFSDPEDDTMSVANIAERLASLVRQVKLTADRLSRHLADDGEGNETARYETSKTGPKRVSARIPSSGSDKKQGRKGVTKDLSPSGLAICEDWTRDPDAKGNIGNSDQQGSNDNTVHLPAWQNKLMTFGTLGDVAGSKSGYCLTEWLQVRIYPEDPAKWTIRELKQWLHFMFLSGVQHVYLCDHYEHLSEKLDTPLRKYIDLNLVTYIPWGPPENITRVAIDAQTQCYDYIVRTYGYLSRWQIAIDMDEYPFAPRDIGENFLSRYLRHITKKQGAKISEISLSNYLMLGQGDRGRDLVISRINRVTKKPENGLIKPIFRPDRVREVGVHHNDYNRGSRLDADPDELMMLHYWGARLQNWGPDTELVLDKTVAMDDMRAHWANRLRNSLLAFDEMDALSNSTGP